MLWFHTLPYTLPSAPDSYAGTVEHNLTDRAIRLCRVLVHASVHKATASCHVYRTHNRPGRSCT